MRLVRFLAQGKPACGIVQGDEIAEVEGDFFLSRRAVKARHLISAVKLLAPCAPSKVVAVGLNYRDHAREMGFPVPGEPILFLKPPTAVIGPGEAIVYPVSSGQLDYEAELGVVIRDRVRAIGPEEAPDHILGYTCANDVSARDWQIKRGGGQWCRGKTFATFCPLGPCLVTADEIPDPNTLGIKTILNGQAMQDWNTNDMIFDVPTLIEFLSGSTLLLPGTVILTGTPHGVGGARKPPVFLKHGDTVTIEIEKIGSLTNPVQDEPT